MEDSAGQPAGISQTGGDLTADDADEGRLHVDYALLRLFSEASSRKEYLDSIADLVHRWAGFRCVGIRVLDAHGNIPYESYVGFSDAFLKSENWLTVKQHNCACIRVILGKPGPALAMNLTQNGSFHSSNLTRYLAGLKERQRALFRSSCWNFGFRSMAIVPVRHRGRIIGAIHMADEAEGKASPAVLAFIESLTPLIGIAMGRLGMEESLRASEHDFVDLYENAPNAYWSAGADGSIRRCNRKAAEMLGYDRADLAGRSVLDLYAPGPEGRDKAERLLRLFQAGETISNEELKMRRSDGKPVWISLTVNAVHDAAGQVTESRAIVVDITERRDSQVELCRSQESLAEAQRIARLGNWDWDMVNDTLFWSDEIYRIFGREPQEFGATYEAFLEYVHPDDRGVVDAGVAAAVRGEKPYDVFHRVRLPDGSERIVHERAEVEYGAGGQPVRMIGTVQDVTEARRAEAEIYRKNDLLETMYASTGLMVAYMDTDFNIIRVNRAYARADGHEPEYYAGKNHFDLFPDKENEAIFRRVAETGQGFSVEAKPFEYPLNPERGTTYWDWGVQPVHEADGSVSGVVLSLIDVTDREHARQALEDRTRHAESLARVAVRLNSSLDIEDVEAELCRDAALALDLPAASVSLFDWKTGSLMQSTSYGLPSEFCASMEPLATNVLGSPVNEGAQVHIFPEVLDSGLPCKELYRRLDIRTRVCALMEREGELVGSLNLYSIGAPRQFSGDDVSLLQALASQGALAISNASLFEEAEHRLEQIVALRRIDTAITSSLDLQLTLNVFLEQVIAQLGVEAADILLLNKGNNRLEFAAGKGFHSSAMQYSSLEIGQGIAGKVAIDRRMVRIDDTERLQREFAGSRHFASEGFRLYHATPLISRGQIKGVLEVFQRRLLEPQPEWLELLQTFASQGAIAVDNASLFSDLQRSNIELSQAYDATLEGWSHALELRDRETEGHTRRVADMTVELARRLGIPEADIVNFRRGAILHDIGKMGIPDSILLKPGPLDEGEWEIMRMHTVYGHDMLSPIGYLRPALDIPYCHHERWDGAGYPRGLKGEEIPLMARVFAFADVWDALSSDRPYRDAWPREKVLEHMRGAIGSHFDPDIGPVFLEMQV